MVALIQDLQNLVLVSQVLILVICCQIGILLKINPQMKKMKIWMMTVRLKYQFFNEFISIIQLFDFFFI
ncbi:MAG: hypothetical protein DMG62_24150 [Acidobacteria bacterium]|nr:MAG: hypothetical protein DMG62_24150 [Acidobacteriota bacterium]